MMRRGPLEDEGIDLTRARRRRRAAGGLALGRDLALDDARVRGRLTGYCCEYVFEVLSLEVPFLVHADFRRSISRRLPASGRSHLPSAISRPVMSPSGNEQQPVLK